MARFHAKESYYSKASTKDSHRKAPALIRISLCLRPRLFLIDLYTAFVYVYTCLGIGVSICVRICVHMTMRN